MAGKPPLRVGDALRLKIAGRRPGTAAGAAGAPKGIAPLGSVEPYYNDNVMHAIRRVTAVTEVGGTQFVDVRIENAGGFWDGKVFPHQYATLYVLVTRADDDDPNGR
jgi:hypothetical protein